MQGWGVAESSGRLPALLSAMVECVKEVTTDLDCGIDTRPDLCAKKLRQKRVQRVEKVTALMTARSKSGSSQEPEEEEDSGSEEDDKPEKVREKASATEEFRIRGGREDPAELEGDGRAGWII